MDNDRDILLITILTFFTVFAWIFFELVKTTRTSTVSEQTQQLLKPLNTNIDTDTFQILETRKNFK